MHLRNASNATLGFPGCVVVPPGESIEVDESVALNRVVAAWINRGSVIVESGKPMQTPEEEAKDDTKADIIAKLEAHGVVRDKRTSKASLEKLLAEVEGGD